jgi:tetratricopeptide (TPR) repeat protein
LGDEILLKRARAMEIKGEWTRALGYFDDIIKFYENDILVDDAMFKSAELMETKMNLPERALERYKELLLRHPGSLYSHETRKRIRRLRGEEISIDEDL